RGRHKVAPGAPIGDARCMRRWLIASGVLALIAAGSEALAAEPPPRWVFFRDKDVAGRRDEALAERAGGISPRALVRRQMARGDLGVDDRDLAVPSRYIHSVEATGAR